MVRDERRTCENVSAFAFGVDDFVHLMFTINNI